MFSSGIGLAILATVFFSTSPILTRLGTDLPPTQVSFARMFGGSLFIALFSVITSKEAIIPTFKPKYILYGIITAFHFLFYIWSLYYTTIAHTLVIVYTAPMYVYIYEILSGHRPAKSEITGMLLVVLGLSTMLGFQPVIEPTIIIGNIMAFISAFCLAAYSLVGRREKNQVNLLPYAFWLYFLSALVLAPMAVPEMQLNLGWSEIISMLGLALIPTALGHTIYNAALRKVRSFYPSIIATQEVTGGVLLGIVFLSEIPTIQTCLGGLISLIGIVIIVYRSQKNDSSHKFS